MDGSLPIKRGREGDEGWSEPEEDTRFKLSKHGERSISRSSSSGSASACSNPFQSLSNEVIDLIFQFLPRRELATRVICVDKRFYSVAQGDLGTLAHQGKVAYKQGNFVEAGRCFASISVSGPGSSADSDSDMSLDVSGSGGVRGDFAECVIRLRFLDIPAINSLSDAELQSMSHDELRELWVEHVEPRMNDWTGKAKAESQQELYRWSQEAAKGTWGDQPVSPEERVYCCERLIFLLLYSKNEAVRRDAMLALVRVAREMDGDGDLEKMLVEQSIGRVVDFMSQSGGIESIGGIAKIVFENLKRQDCSFIAKQALLSGLGRALSSVSEELKGLLAQKVDLESKVDAILKDFPEAVERKEVEAQLEERKGVAAEIDRLNRERKNIVGPFGRSFDGGVTISSIEARLATAHARLQELQGESQEIAQLRAERDELRSTLWLGDEGDEQALAAVEARLKELTSVRNDIESLKREIERCKEDLNILKIDERLAELNEDVLAIQVLRDRKSVLDDAVRERLKDEKAYQELVQVEARIISLNSFVRGFIRNVSIELAMESLASSGDSGAEIRDMLVKHVANLAVANIGESKTFGDVLKLFSYIIGQSSSVTNVECLNMGRLVLDLERAHPSPDRSQRVNEWLFSIGTSDLQYPQGFWVEDEFIVAWLDRITDDHGALTEPIPLARIGRLAKALGAPGLKDETRWRIYNVLTPQIESLIGRGERSPEVLHIFKSLSDSFSSCLQEISETQSGLSFQREAYEFLDNLSGRIPKEWNAIRAAVEGVKSDVPDLVQNALMAPVIDSQGDDL